MPRQYRVENFKYGIINKLENKTIPPGSASRALNWQTKGDKIELRRGYAILGGTDAGVGRVTGAWIANDVFGNEVPLRKIGRKLQYYDVDTLAWVEIGSDLFPAAASDEDVFFDNITGLAGAQTWCGSPNSGLYKIMINGGRSSKVAPSAEDNYSAAKNHKGYIKIKKNRIILWGKLEDPAGLRGSYIDAMNYTTVTNEVLGTGDAVDKTFSGTLAAVTGIRTCFAIVVDAVVVGGGTETFTDNRDGTLTSNLGGTGTINYQTGAISLIFNTAPDTAQSVLVDYQWEDSTNGGLADFTESATRVAGQGFYLQQGDGGELMNVETLNDVEYCIHKYKTWAVDLTNDDTNATNEIFREKAGIPNQRASLSTGDGIYYVDDRDESDVKIRILKIYPGSTEVIPSSISNNLDLSDYRFDQAAIFEFGDFILVTCRTKDSVDSSDVGVNNRVLVYNKLWKSWDVVDYSARMFFTYGGALHCGDSLSKNILELFSGFDDNGAENDNYYDTNLDEMQLRELKKSRSLIFEGEIQTDKTIEIWISVDNSSYVKLGDIEGDGAYVDVSQSVTVGATTIGKLPVGGGNSADVVTAYHYMKEMRVRNIIDKFQRVSLRFIGTGIGYASISSYEHFDITLHGARIPSKYNIL